MRCPLLVLIAGLALVLAGVLIHITLAQDRPSNSVHPYTNFHFVKPSSKPTGKATSTKPKPSPSPTTKPISPHNLLAADADFLALADQTCRDDNARVLKLNSDYHVGMWWFQGPDKHGEVTVYCRGYMEKNNLRVWFDLDPQNDTQSDTLFVRI